MLAGVNHTQPLRALLRPSAIFVAVIGVCLWPSVALLIGMAVFPLIYFQFVALPMAFVIGVLHTC